MQKTIPFHSIKDYIVKRDLHLPNLKNQTEFLQYLQRGKLYYSFDFSTAFMAATQKPRQISNFSERVELKMLP